MIKKELEEVFEIAKLFIRAVKKAQQENWCKGLPNVYSINGKVVYALPNGELATEYKF